MNNRHYAGWVFFILMVALAIISADFNSLVYLVLGSAVLVYYNNDLAKIEKLTQALESSFDKLTKSFSEEQMKRDFQYDQMKESLEEVRLVYEKLQENFSLPQKEEKPSRALAFTLAVLLIIANGILGLSFYQQKNAKKSDTPAPQQIIYQGDIEKEIMQQITKKGMGNGDFRFQKVRA